MVCNRICVSNFRNIEKAEVVFSDGVNVLVGKNAQGKTNLLEAIFYMSIGKSFRALHDEELIRFGAEMAEISMDFTDSVRQQNLTVRMMAGKRRRIEQNRVKLTRVSDMVGQFRTVLFCPEHLSLIKEGPAERRNFLDIAISQLYPLYIKSLQRYHQLLKQRNQLIRRANEDYKTFADTVELWSLQLAEEAAIISQYRYRYLLSLNREMQECFLQMKGEEEVPLSVYRSSSGLSGEDLEDLQKLKEAYIRLLTTRLDREVAAGSTLWGIHKDDVEILLNGKSARMFASQGQQRSLALSMKLAEGEVCNQICGEMPVFLFDDVFSELDEGRRAFLAEKLEGKQVIITSCDSECVKNKDMIFVSQGSYFRTSG